MAEHVHPDYLKLSRPDEIPGLVACWDFRQPGERFPATEGEGYVLESRAGELNVVADASAPLGGTALEINEGQWLNMARMNCPRLDFHGHAPFTLIAWLKRGQKSNGECEFIAGQWNESQRGRQYGLFLNISVWQTSDQVCGHLSHVGGPTPGYKYCIDGPMGATPVPRGEWCTVAMSYDGTQGFAWLNGQLDARPALNPYSMAGGLFNGGPDGSDFTVGAVDRGGNIGNFFTGHLAGLAAYDRALTPAEMYALARL